MAKKKRQTTRTLEAAPTTAPSQRPARLLAAGGLALALSLAAVVLGFVIFSDDDGGASEDGLQRAVIVDQLELTAPNPDFVSGARETLSEAGYAVDYIHGKDVTVDFYRTLASRDYDLVLLRVHAGITREVDASGGATEETEYVSLFTGEPYDETKYGDETLNYLGKARYTDDSDPLFGIGPRFVKDKMEGDFGGALVVLMGCDGLRSQVTAEAFTDKGASAFVSWTDQVSAPHTDDATQKFLQRYLIDGIPLRDAVSQTAAEVGPDQAFGGELRVFPPS